MSSRLSVGLAIGMDSLVATWKLNGQAIDWRTSFAGNIHRPPSVESIRSAFADLKVHLPVDARTALAIAILPPLARVRRIELPRMSDDDRRLAVSRAAERHFVGLGESVVCAIAGRNGRGRAVPFFAAAASSDLIRDLEQVATESGWVIVRVVPAHTAWITAARHQWRELRRGNGRLLIANDRETTVLTVRRGEMSAAHRLRPASAAPPDGELRTFIVGDAIRAAAFIAAESASLTRALQLASDSVRQARRVAQARAARWLFCAAAACVVTAGGAYRWGLSQRLDVIAKHRLALRAQVHVAAAARDTLEHLVRSVNAVRSLERVTPRWSLALARVAVALPRDASLIALRADGDSVSLDGQAGDAASVFAALRSAPGIINVRSTAPIRQELSIGQASIERWTIALHVARSVK